MTAIKLWRALRGVLSAALPLAVLACASAPATDAQYEAKLQAWVGRSAEDLAHAWGPPQGVEKLADGSRLLTYRRERTIVVPGDMGTPVIATRQGPVLVGNASPWVTHGTCTTTFAVGTDGLVTKWSYAGNRC